MTDVITFWVSTTTDLWNLIIQHWLLSISVLLSMINLVISIVNTSTKGNS